MAILLIMPDENPATLVTALHQLGPDLDIRIWPDAGAPDDVDYAIVWKAPAGSLAAYPHLQVVASFAAGVDHIFADPDLPQNITITRLVDDILPRQMADYVAGVILSHRLGLGLYREYQAAGHWHRQSPKSGNHVCLLGLGVIGQTVAAYLNRLDFTVSGWCRSPKTVKNVTVFHGKDAWAEAIREADYIVCLLPLTAETAYILNQDFFRKVKTGAYLINVGRGSHLQEDDLLEALYQGRLGGACLDVFETEPLPADHPFWRHPRLMMTPHIASMTDIATAAGQFYDNYRYMKAGQPLKNTIDRAKGY